ncbi:MarR family transcriptional regulator [Aestuariicella sp. G3-2]|uniref:GbsR/MarR family transcriptional regulator n=1 Tax=Pseudomaricurvus albidus TaxID=2842452 RepID=UPI001C0CD380|nr:MarR family transcriptional regulator [Aestuariicella albida]
MKLSDSSQALVLHFGEMGSRWGFNRTVGQILALLTIHPEPLNADHLAEALHVSRGNVSMGLKELQAWRLIERQHQPGDRKEYFTPSGSIWDMARIVFEERRKRELDPTLSLLRQQLLSASEDSGADYTQAKMQEIYDLLEQLNTFANSLHDMEPERLKKLMSMGAGVSKVLNFGSKKKSSPSSAS